MTRRRQLTIACGSYDRTHALESGSIRPDGLDLVFISKKPIETFWRQLRFAEFDASEMSMSAHILLTARGNSPFVAIPAFTSRAFRHGCIFVSRKSGIKTPEQLAGRRVGVPQYHQTAALWIRGMLLDDYSIQAADINWVQGGLDMPGYPERVELQLPGTIAVQHESRHSLSDLLISGKIDAIICAELPSPMRNGDSRVLRLFEDHRHVEQDYYRRTQFFPIMHCIAIRRQVYEDEPWIARSLFDAFCEAKDAAFAELGNRGAATTMLPWQVAAHSEAVALMGVDYWRYGVRSSLHELEAMCRYSYEQGLSATVFEAQALFAEETIDTLPASAVQKPEGARREGRR